MIAYLKRHHIGLLALFFALGGVSYAATLPRNSVGSGQLRAGAVTRAKLAKGVRQQLAAKGKAGPRGAQGERGAAGAAGPQGERGATGAQGAAGVAGAPGVAGAQGVPGPQGEQGLQGLPGLVGPTSVGVGGLDATVAPALTSSGSNRTTVTLRAPGKVLVFVSGRFSITCLAGVPCSRTIGVLLDDRTVPGAFAVLGGDPGEFAVREFSTAGVVVDVPAGTHTAQIASAATGRWSGQGNSELRLVALAVGND